MFIPDFQIRIDFLTNIRNGLIEKKEYIKAAYCLESNLSSDRFEIEFTRTVLQIDNFIAWLAEGDLPFPSIDVDFEKGIDLRKTHLPIGKVLVFGASNFPLAYSTIGGDVVSAFAAGCPVVFKAHPYHLETGKRVAEIIISAIKAVDLPNDWFVFEDGPISKAEEWILNPNIKAIGFTGSKEIGLHIQSLAQQRKSPIPVFAEMGSLNPIFIDANQENAKSWAQQIAQAVSSNAGQFCTKPGLLFILENENTCLFLSELNHVIENASSHAFLHPNLKNRFLNSLQEIELLNQSDFERVSQDLPLIKIIEFKDFKNQTKLLEECFGPFSIVVKCKVNADFIEATELIEGQLSAAVFCPDLTKYEELIDALKFKVGRVIHNQVTTGVQVLPSMHHGGPFPATNESRFSAVGIDSVLRFLVPVCYQNFPESLLPKELWNKNYTNKLRRINGNLSIKDI